MNEHTPGPWHVEHDDQFGRSYVCHPETVCTATTVCEIETPRRQADARLIAAAPELLAALDPDMLEAIADEIDCFEHSARSASLRVLAREQRAAIAKARGAQL